MYWAAGYNMLIFPGAYHTLLWTFSCHFQYKHCLTNLPGVVGGTSSATIFALLVLFSIASSLGCFWSIVFIGAGVMFFSFLEASSNSSLLERRYYWKISSTYSERVNMYMYARSILTLFCFSVHQNSTKFLINCKLFNFMNPSESRPPTPPKKTITAIMKCHKQNWQKYLRDAIPIHAHITYSTLMETTYQSLG